MATSKDTRQRRLTPTVSDEKAVADLASIMKLATQAMDGAALSDNELDDLCDAALSLPVRPEDRFIFSKR